MGFLHAAIRETMLRSGIDLCHLFLSVLCG